MDGCTNVADLFACGIAALFAITMCIILMGALYVLIFKDPNK